MNLEKYIEIAKRNLNVKSDSKVAESIGITRSALSQAKRGDATLSHDTLGKLARICNEKPEKVLADYELNRPHTPEIKSMWERIAGHAAVITIALPFLNQIQEYIYYVKLSIESDS